MNIEHFRKELDNLNKLNHEAEAYEREIAQWKDYSAYDMRDMLIHCSVGGYPAISEDTASTIQKLVLADLRESLNVLHEELEEYVSEEI